MMLKIFDPILNLFRFQKLKLLIAIVGYVVFLYLFFPFSDTADLISSKVSEMTQGQVFLDFNKLDLSLFPAPGVELSNVSIETPFTGSLTAKSIEASPSIPSLLAFKPGVNVHAEELLGGSVDISTRQLEKLGGGDKNQPVRRRQKIDVEMSGVSLSSLSKLADLPLKLDGRVSGTFETSLDPLFLEQPSASIDIHGEKAALPEGNINTPMGPLTLPHLGIGEVIVQGHSDKGQVELSKVILGKQGGDIYANVNGRADLKIVGAAPNLSPQMGGYDLNVKLQVGPAFQQKMGAFLSFLSAYQTAQNYYTFRISAPNAYSPPNIQKAQ